MSGAQQKLQRLRSTVLQLTGALRAVNEERLERRDRLHHSRVALARFDKEWERVAGGVRFVDQEQVKAWEKRRAELDRNLADLEATVATLESQYGTLTGRLQSQRALLNRLEKYQEETRHAQAA